MLELVMNHLMDFFMVVFKPNKTQNNKHKDLIKLWLKTMVALKTLH